MHSLEYENKRIIYCTYISVLLGCFISSLFFLCLVSFTNCNILDYGLEDYQILGLMSVPELKILFYIIKRRGIQLLVFALINIMLSYYAASSLYCLTIGAYIGMVFCSMFIKFGFTGLGYGAICFFPHYIFYFLAIYLAGKWFFNQTNYKKIYYENVNKMFFLIKIIVIIFMLILGTIWEIKFQKVFLNYFYQHIV